MKVEFTMSIEEGNLEHHFVIEVDAHYDEGGDGWDEPKWTEFEVEFIEILECQIDTGDDLKEYLGSEIPSEIEAKWEPILKSRIDNDVDNCHASIIEQLDDIGRSARAEAAFEAQQDVKNWSMLLDRRIK